MKIEKDAVVFATGTIKYANKGIIGLSPDMHVYDGYDGDFHWPREDWMEDEDFDGLSYEEQIDLADYMIAAWKKFKAEAI